MTKLAQTNSNQSLWLYRLVFHTRATRVFVLFVVCWLLLQPAFVVYANESSDVVQAAPEQETNTEPAADPVERSVETEEEIVEETIPEDTQEENQLEAPAEQPPRSTDVEAVDSENATTTNDGVASSTPVATSSTSTDSTASSTTLATTSSDGTDTPANQADDSEESNAATTTEPTTKEQSTVTTNDSYYQFSRDDCVRVEDGSFYCGQTQSAQPVEDSFYVALDSDGDRELFAVLSGEKHQITHNTRDDAAPYYDQHSETLVWHTLIDGRYQIMSYDFDTEEEVQLTTGRTNNMEPTRYEAYTVWQQWSNDGWEIMMHDGDTVMQLTSNTAADIAPSVHEGHVIWKRVFSDEQVAVVYDIKTGTETTVTDTEDGTAFKNARMMLVYEGVTETGDRVIRGVDPRSGKVVPIQSLPSELPDEVPTSEPTEEVRALVQQKPSTEQEEVEVIDPSADTNATGTDAATATSSATSTNELTLVIPAVAEVEVSATSTPNLAATTTEFDLVIPPNATSSEG